MHASKYLNGACNSSRLTLRYLAFVSLCDDFFTGHEKPITRSSSVLSLDYRTVVTTAFLQTDPFLAPASAYRSKIRHTSPFKARRKYGAVPALTLDQVAIFADGSVNVAQALASAEVASVMATAVEQGLTITLTPQVACDADETSACLHRELFKRC
jgi:hypothetical protein